MKKILIKNKNILFCFGIAFITLFFCSKNSPFYPYNNWVDEHAFFTVGKAWANGIIPYRDIFEQKGPLLYFIFMIASLIDSSSFLVIFLLEVISFGISLCFVFKMVNLFLEKKYVYFLVLLFASIFTSSVYFTHGGSAEEFCLPFLMFTFYDMMRYLVKGNKISYFRYFIHGVCAGSVLLIKFTLIGFWFGFMVSMILILGIREKYKELLWNSLIFLLGMFLPFLLFSIYFLVVGAFFDFIDVYFYFNLFAYPDKMFIGIRIIKMFETMFNLLIKNKLILILLLVSGGSLVFSKQLFQGKGLKLSILFIFFFGMLGVFFGCKEFIYYFLIFVPFILLGMVFIFYLLINRIRITKKGYVFISCIVLCLSIFLITTSSNLEYAKNEKKDLVQFKFAKIIREKEGKSLLNYGFLDGGFYMATDILPNTKYFELQNAVVPNMEETLEREISSYKFDFIVVRGIDSKKIDLGIIPMYYDFVTVDSEVLEKIKFNYYLYERKNLNEK